MRSPHAALTAALLCAIALPAFAEPPPPIIDNDRVVVWDVKLAEGELGEVTPKDRDVVIMVLEGKDPGFGTAIYVPRGSERRDIAPAGGLHEVVIWLKDAPHLAVPNTTKYPLAFPRAGAVKLLDNAQVATWRYCWQPNVPTKMHFHNKDVVVAYRYDGALKSVTPDGTATQNDYKAGDIRFNKADRIHYELLVGEKQCAMMTELK